MTVIPQADTLSGTTSTGTNGVPGFNRFTSGSQSIDLPQVTTQSVVTKLTTPLSQLEEFWYKSIKSLSWVSAELEEQLIRNMYAIPSQSPSLSSIPPKELQIIDIK